MSFNGQSSMKAPCTRDLIVFSVHAIPCTHPMLKRLQSEDYMESGGLRGWLILSKLTAEQNYGLLTITMKRTNLDSYVFISKQLKQEIIIISLLLQNFVLLNAVTFCITFREF